ARLEEQWRAGQWPDTAGRCRRSPRARHWRSGCRGEVGTREQETLPIAREEAVRPIRLRPLTDQDSQAIGRYARIFARVQVAQPERLEPVAPFSRGHLGAIAYRQVGHCFELLDQVV